MGQTLCVNQKEYLPSAELGKKFNYTSDYISKLARDEKVLGTRVGRQWFIEPESLRTYIQQLEIEKQINKENLSRERKLEHKQHTDGSARQGQAAVAEAKPLITAGQSLSILLCGFLVGVMSWTVYANELTFKDLHGGAAIVTAQVAKVTDGFSIVVDEYFTDKKSLANPLFGVEAYEKIAERTGPQFQLSGHYTTLPIIINQSTSTLTQTSEVKNDDEQVSSSEYRLPFSDDLVVDEKAGELRVRPVFRNSMGDLYEVSAIPVGIESN